MRVICEHTVNTLSAHFRYARWSCRTLLPLTLIHCTLGIVQHTVIVTVRSLR